jgi:hypothetical protein
MSLGWKLLLPTALAYIVIVAGLMLGLQMAGIRPGLTYGLIFLAVNVVLLVVLFVIMDRGRIVSPASGRIPAGDLARLRGVSRTRAQLSTETGD